jgi:RecJ-like exonuclease
MRWTVSLLAALVGCMLSLPAENDDVTVTADLAAEGARLVVQLRQTIPPTPTSDRCENCDGTGIIGDGRVKVKCPVCDGTGKQPVSVCANCES